MSSSTESTSSTSSNNITRGNYYTSSSSTTTSSDSYTSDSTGKREIFKNEMLGDLLISKIENDLYDLVERIGEGANGEIFKAIDRSTGKEIAVKVVNLVDERRKNLFAKEIEHSFALGGHNNILNYFTSHQFTLSSSIDEYDFDDEVKEMIEQGHIEFLPEEPREFGVIAMEILNGDLIDLVVNQDIPSDEVRAIFYSLCDAVHHCHSNQIFHLDIKPDNVLLQLHPITRGVKNVKLCDFGHATSERFLTLPSNSKKPPPFGTPSYLPPECFPPTSSRPTSLPPTRTIQITRPSPPTLKTSQTQTHLQNLQKTNSKNMSTQFLNYSPKNFKNEIRADKVDIWSLGVTLFVLLTKQFPFIVKKDGTFLPNDQAVITDPAARDLIDSLLHLNPLRRPTIRSVLRHHYFQSLVHAPCFLSSVPSFSSFSSSNSSSTNSSSYSSFNSSFLNSSENPFLSSNSSTKINPSTTTNSPLVPSLPADQITITNNSNNNNENSDNNNNNEIIKIDIEPTASPRKKTKGNSLKKSEPPLRQSLRRVGRKICEKIRRILSD